jgi:hypothetical protein
MKDWGANYPDLSGYSVPAREWAALTPGQKESSLLSDALDYKRELLALPRPAADDLGLPAIQFRSLLLKATDSIISQVLQVEANALHKQAQMRLARGGSYQSAQPAIS